ALSPDGKVLAVASKEGAVQLRRTDTGEVGGRLPGDGCPILALAFMPDGKRLVAARTDATALVWDVAALLPPEPVGAGKLSAQELEARWADLAASDGAKAYRAMRRLAKAPAQAVPFLTTRLQPAKAADPTRLARLLADLGDARLAARRTAAEELEALGD